MGDPARANRIALPQLGQIAISSMLTVSTCMALSYFRVVGSPACKSGAKALFGPSIQIRPAISDAPFADHFLFVRRPRVDPNAPIFTRTTFGQRLFGSHSFFSPQKPA